MVKNHTLLDYWADVIRQHIIDPEHSDLPDELRPQLNRIIQVSRLLDDYPDESHIINIMLAKYKMSRSQVVRDIQLARELFKTSHTFDWDFWQAWMIRDQIQLINECKLNGDLKNWNNAKKVLHDIIGEKPAGVEDPRRMEKNVFYIQVNNAGQVMNVPLDAVKGLTDSQRKAFIDAMQQPVDDSQAEEIMNS